MISLSRITKALIVISLFSLLLWVIYWLIPSFTHFLNIILGLPDQYTGREWYFVPSHFGLIARFVAVTLGLAVSLSVWVRNMPFIRIRRLVAGALFLEAAYWLSLLPSSLSLITRSPSMATLGIAYLTQIVLAAPLLLVIATKVAYCNCEKEKASLWRWAGYAFLGYVGALWVNAVLRWVDMLLGEGFAFFGSGVRSLGFFDAVIFMSLAWAFAVAGAYCLSKQNMRLARKWVGLALAMVGLHYVIYLVYSSVVNALGYVLLVDVWSVPLLGLGISLLFTGDANLKLNGTRSNKTTCQVSSIQS